MGHDKIGPREAQLRAMREARVARANTAVVRKVKPVVRAAKKGKRK